MEYFLYFLFNYLVWLVLAFLIFVLWKQLWLNYVMLKYDLSLRKIVLEIKMPSIVTKTPKAMENFFSSLYSIRMVPDFIGKYIKGEHQPEVAFEIVGISGATHFFVRTPENFKDLIIANINSNFPDAEISEVKDYMKNLPASFDDEKYNLWGTEFLFNKEDPYPIKTYKYFKDEVDIGPGPSGEVRTMLDPLLTLFELMSDLESGEQVWVSYVLRPAGSDWQKQGKALIDQLLGKKVIKKKNFIDEIFEFIVNLILAIFRSPVWGSHETEEVKEEKGSELKGDIIKAIEEKISKHGYHSMVRVVYFAEKDSFSRSRIPALMGVFNNYYDARLNGFRPNSKVTTTAVGRFMGDFKSRVRKRRLYFKAKKRLFTTKGIILNTTELATLYHFPSTHIESYSLPRVESKKVQPPRHLPRS